LFAAIKETVGLRESVTCPGPYTAGIQVSYFFLQCPLPSCYPKHDPQIRSINSAWKLVRNTALGSPRPTNSEFTDPQVIEMHITASVLPEASFRKAEVHENLLTCPSGAVSMLSGEKACRYSQMQGADCLGEWMPLWISVVVGFLGPP